MALVAIVMGSQSDAAYMQQTTEVLDRLGISCEHAESRDHGPIEPARGGEIGGQGVFEQVRDLSLRPQPLEARADRADCDRSRVNQCYARCFHSFTVSYSSMRQRGSRTVSCAAKSHQGRS